MFESHPVPDIFGEGEAACPTCGTRVWFPNDATVPTYLSMTFSVICGCGLLIEAAQIQPETT